VGTGQTAYSGLAMMQHETVSWRLREHESL
jgi:hypothetical protein